jgi:hypothetical protein
VHIQWNHSFVVFFKGYKICQSGSMEGLSVKTLALDDNCKIVPLNFHREFY